MEWRDHGPFGVDGLTGAAGSCVDVDQSRVDRDVLWREPRGNVAQLGRAGSAIDVDPCWVDAAAAHSGLMGVVGSDVDADQSLGVAGLYFNG